MRVFEIMRRVIYADTDKMGVVYYSNYLRWFEMGRTEMLREIGVPYTELEAAGYNLPVSEVFCKYLAPARYDDFLRIKTCVDEIRNASLRFGYRISNEKSDDIILTGYTLHACVDDTGKIIRLPSFLKDALQ
ncbi:MAG: acyl-CoA thioesterase [Desulfobacterales bacterium]|nr:acyl-CoA thioesterase [Desulfobacterales bacterium]